MKRYLITAFGSAEHPNLKGEFDEVPEDILRRGYSYVGIQRLEPISLETAKRLLDQQGYSSSARKGSR